MILVSSLAFFLIAFLLGSILLAVLWLVFLRSREEERDVAESEQGLEEPSVLLKPETASERSFSSTLFREERMSTITFWDTVLNYFDFADLMRKHLEQADLAWSVGRVTSMMLLVGTVAGLIASKLIPTWAALLAGALAASIPYQYILHSRTKRFRKFQEGFPDVLDSMARALRAGYPLSAAMEMIAAETAPPVSLEIRRTSTEANLGSGWQRALDGLGKRIPLLEVNMFIAAVQLHARTGGKLSEVLIGLAENMRESIALQGEVRALSAHGKLTGLILTCLPIGIAAMMTYVAPQYMQSLYNHPWGKNMIGAAVLCLVLAHFVIRKLVEIKI